MTNGARELDDMLARIRGLSELTLGSAPAVADAVETVIRKQIKQGRSAEGETWQKTKEGGRPLQRAEKALAVVAVGQTVFARLTGPEARHNSGTARGGVVRPILPVEGLPRDMVEAIRDAVVAEFKDRVQ
jgi:hypothetical protein